MEPINIFSHRIDPRGVVALLRSLTSAVLATGRDDAWQEAPEDVFRSALSSALERHKAINWLTGGGIYSQTDTPT